MSERLAVDICVIGAGAGGLSVAMTASRLGADTAIIEKGRMGGDCLNFGCVPSKSLLAAGRAAVAGRDDAAFGLGRATPEVDFAAVGESVRAAIEAIAPHDSEARFAGFGVHVIRATARFVGPREVEADGRRISARRFVVATGSAPVVPAIPGLDGVPHFTNETIFDNRVRPAHLIVIGGGPVGVELAQAHRHLGAQVTLIEMAEVLGGEDRELAEVVINRLRRDGVEVVDRARVERVERTAAGLTVSAATDGGVLRVDGSHLLVAVGRRANVDGLGLEAAGIRYSAAGIAVDSRLRTTNRKVYAVGDVIGGGQYTHLAGYHAAVVIKNALFRLPVKADHRGVPRVTYTDPELAQVGLGEAEARALHGGLRILRWPFAENDRACTERRTDGLIKVVTTRRGRVLGAGIAGPHAGEIIQPWVLAVRRGMKIGVLAGMMAPYPTFAEVNRSVAMTFYAPLLLSERMRRVVRFLLRFG